MWRRSGAVLHGAKRADGLPVSATWTVLHASQRSTVLHERYLCQRELRRSAARVLHSPQWTADSLAAPGFGGGDGWPGVGEHRQAAGKCGGENGQGGRRNTFSHFARCAESVFTVRSGESRLSIGGGAACGRGCPHEPPRPRASEAARSGRIFPRQSPAAAAERGHYPCGFQEPGGGGVAVGGFAVAGAVCEGGAVCEARGENRPFIARARAAGISLGAETSIGLGCPGLSARVGHGAGEEAGRGGE